MSEQKMKSEPLSRRESVAYLKGKLDGNVQALKAAMAERREEPAIDLFERMVDGLGEFIDALAGEARDAIAILEDNALERFEEDVPDWREAGVTQKTQ